MMQFNIVENLYNKIASICGLDEAIETSSSAAAIDEISSGMNDLSQYLGYRYYDQERRLFINDGNIAGFMLEVSPIVGVDDSIIKNLQHFFNDEMPADSYLQFLLVASHDVDNILTFWERERINNHPVLKKITQKSKDFIKERAVDFGVSDGRIARDYRIFVSYSQVINVNSQNDISSITSFRNSLINKLESLQLSPIECAASSLIQLVRSIIQMQLSDAAKIKYAPDILLSKQILEPCHIHEIREDRIEHHTTKLSSKLYHIKELPSEFSLSAGINLLGDNSKAAMGIPARFIISYSVANNLSNAAEHKIVGRGKKVIESADKWYSHRDRDLKREAAEWQDINDRANSGEHFLSEHWQLMVTAPSESIDLVNQNLISLYNLNNFRLETSSNLQLPTMLAILPMMQELLWSSLDRFKLTRLVLSQEIVSRIPIHAEWKRVPKSGLLLHARRGQLFNFNPFYKISSGNYNICIFAPSGGGKSVFLQAMAVSLMSQNTRMFILDIGQSFANICNLLQGEIVQFGRNAPISLNPFASFHSDMQPEDRDEFLKCTKGLLEVMCGVGDDARGAAELEKAITASLQKSNYNIDISGFAEFLEASNSTLLQKYGATLYPYTKDGIYGKYFSGGKHATFKSLITVFEFEEIKNDEKLLSIILQILLMEVTNQFLTGDRNTPFMIIVDEAWMLLDYAASFFAAFVRTVRKYGGSLVICVQNFMDLQKSADHRTILENSTWTILLKQDEKGLGAFKESEAFKDMLPLIKSISLVPGRYAEALIYTTGVSVVGRLVLDDYSSALFSTDAKDFNFLRNCRLKGLGLDAAIEELVTRKRLN